ncbi:MAG: dihydrolipoyl dehydrogenase [candidate division WOR-3 bacterium]
MTSDVLVIGAGPAGYVAAIRLAQLGKKVVLVEQARVGGVCLNQGCIPVKALLHGASIIRNAAEARVMGLRFSGPEIDLVALYSWKARIVERLVRGIEFLLKQNGVELVRGRARFVDRERVVVTGEDGETELGAGSFIIATGSRPVRLSGVETDNRLVIDSSGALNLVEIPKRLVVIGAGAIGLEFATLFARLGSRVTVLEMFENVLPGIDHEIAAALQRLLEREGVRFHFGVQVKGLIHGTPAAVEFACGSDTRQVEADRVLVAVGRAGLTEGLELEKAGVETDEKGFIRTNENYQTTARNIYAIGDVRGGPLLAHKAMAEALLLAEVLGSEGRTGPTGRTPKQRFHAMPWCVYTDPEVARVGLNEREAQGKGLNVKVALVPASAVGRSLTLGRSEGLCKMVVDQKTDRILGVSLLAPDADTMIGEATVAVELGLTAEELGRVVHPHPTMSELLLEAAHAIHGRAIHIVNR